MQQTLDIEAVIQNMVAKLVAEYAPERVILFGSYAYGQPRPDSDIDLLIVKDTSESRSERRSTVRRILAETTRSIPVDTLILTPQELEQRLAIGDHFIQDILEKGKALVGGAYHITMQPEESLYHLEWLRIAEKDFERVNRLLLEMQDPEAAGFYLQQAVEKFFKAFLIYHGWHLQRIHSLETLLDDALAYDASLEEYREVCKKITEFYFAERYPSAGGAELTEETVRDALEQANGLIERLREALQ
jgi:HEPN domain-containing protein/predicted nucleotidyltransferase